MNAVASGGAAQPRKPAVPAKPMKSAVPARSLKERQRQERERLILRAAEELLLERGYHEMSIDDIAERVGISKGTVYLHFAKKGDLVVAMIDCGMRDLLATLDQTLSAPVSPKEKLSMILERMYSRMSGESFQAMSTVMQSPALLGRLVEKRHALQDAWDAPMKRIAAVLEEGKAAGEFDPNMPTPVMLSLFRSLLTPHAYQRLVVQEGMAPDAVVRALTQFYFKGIAPGSPQSSPHGAQAAQNGVVPA